MSSNLFYTKAEGSVFLSWPAFLVQPDLFSLPEGHGLDSEEPNFWVPFKLEGKEIIMVHSLAVFYENLWGRMLFRWDVINGITYMRGFHAKADELTC